MPGYGYGSEWHLLRYLGRHRDLLNDALGQLVGGTVLNWLDFPFNQGDRFLDNEIKGLDFLEGDHPARAAWLQAWPQSGNVQNWDAVGRIKIGDQVEWLLVEAKAHVGELQSSCGAKEHGGLLPITRQLDATKNLVGAAADRDWLHGYYQHANRLTVLRFLREHGVPAKLVCIYFVGDSIQGAPQSRQGWTDALNQMHTHLGLAGQSELESHAYKAFLEVIPGGRNHPLASWTGQRPNIG